MIFCRSIFALLVLGLPLWGWSAAVDLATARDFAKGWRGRAVQAARTVTGAEEGESFHVITFDGGGWAAVGSDDTDAPLIAFSESGEDLVADAHNPLWALVQGDVVCRAKARKTRRGGAAAPVRHRGWESRRKSPKLAVAEDGEAQSALAYGMSALEDVRVAPLVQSAWSQTTSLSGYFRYNTYNYYTPGNVYCGCVATMTAQVMRYHHWPTNAVTPIAKTCWYNGTEATYTMKGGIYDWSKMTLKPGVTATSEANREAIGKLCYDCGVANQMQYGSNGSGTYTSLVADTIINVFGYAYARFVNYDDSYYPFKYDQFKSIIVSNCDAGMPVCLGVRSSSGTGGHAIVADGYGYSQGSFYVHINGGWGGSGDAWYCPPNEIFDGYNAITTAVYNIFPETRGAIVSGRVCDHEGVPLAGAEVTFFTTASDPSAYWLKTTNVVATVTTNEKGIYHWIKGDETQTTYGIKASHKDMLGDKTVSTYRQALTVQAPSTFYNGKQLGYYSKPSNFVLGNRDGVDFTLDLRRPVPKVLRRFQN